MTSDLICRLARRLMAHPAVPYYEHAVRQEVEKICLQRGLPYRRDAFGNLLVHLRSAPRQRPLVLAAHLDHPGFEVLRRLSKQSWLARFRGGVPDAYFRRGIPVRLMPEARLAKLASRKGEDRIFELRATQADELHPAFAVWELEDCAIRHNRIYGRSCDDLIGVATILATLIELKRRRARVNVLGVISRAEEIGFHGALACAAAGTLPKNALVISLETSRELPGLKMGQGVILRVGDRTSIFDPEATRYLWEIASRLARAQQNFRFQRGLMSGGTCEATAYQELGFQTAAVCVALGNYHNCAKGNRIRSEYVSIQDVGTMVELLVQAARQMRRYAELVARLPRQLKKMCRQAGPRLRKTAASARVPA